MSQHRPMSLSSQWKQKTAGLLVAFLLLPLPAYATLTFGAWDFSSANGWINGGSSGAGATNSSTLVFVPVSGTASSPRTYTFRGSVSNSSATSDSLVATFNNLNRITINNAMGMDQLTITISVTYAGSPTTFVNLQFGAGTLPASPVDGDTNNKQDFGAATSNRQIVVTFSFTANDTWTVSATPVSITFTDGG